MNQKGIAPLIIVIIVAVVAVVAGFGIYAATRGGGAGGGGGGGGEVGLTPHDPIYIYGNDNFTSANGVTSGSGTVSDPYIIENWGISAENTYGIEITNTTAYFIICNCLIENGRSVGYVGIELFSAANGKIENCTCDNNNNGIGLLSSDNNTLISNTCDNNYGAGIYLWNSDNNNLTNNTCSGNSYGIYLSANNNTLTGNYLLNNTTPYYDEGTNNHWS